jgi:hypothetical protein
MTDVQEPMQFLTPEESAEVDQALLTSRDKFLTRVAIYSLRSLKQISQQTGLAVEQITPQQIADWIEKDESLRREAEANESFGSFFTQLVLSSLKPLKQVADSEGKAIATLTPSQVIAWFEQEAKTKLEKEQSANPEQF